VSRFHHDYAFDPAYGYTLERLVGIEPPETPPDFAAFWQGRYNRALEIRPEAWLNRHDPWHETYEVYDLSFRSTDDFTLGGWLIAPRTGPVRRGIVVGHGYGGRDGPDFHLPVSDCAFLFPCFRGLARSRSPRVSEQPHWHVLHDIQDPGRYVLGGCVEDVWLSVSALLELFPDTLGHVGYMGISFGGGIGALALPFDPRIRIAHLNVPTFGHVPLRLSLPTLGSGEAVRIHQRRHGNVLETLRYYDAATAAGFSRIPVHVAAALFDPFVAPPGQFAIYNALPEPKRLFVLDAGHFQYPGQAEQERHLLDDLRDFFAPL
jgi:cephalosporin-C deacetylase